ncbi:primosomal protein N' [Pararhodobacter zhoushanensis]|uniref:Replication restart protein PriA n=1 Tax=Pararhodobacter zhoushanensis TaxID=2479545 RepID=A0ABT3H3L5_9RHOB|nr:primosomal protein N' [Pararhodobacter zhoushanensis]MCW1934351.1 primosomal protein N' [Pararhodobacter zhoushanensis]
MQASPVSTFAPGEPLAVLTTQPLDRLLDYRAPEGGAVIGDFVEVPLGPRKVLGCVWGPSESGLPLAKLRAVIRVLDVPPMRDELHSFLMRAAEYTLTPLSLMLFLATRAPGLSSGPAMIRVFRLGNAEPVRMTDARRRVLDVFDSYGGSALTIGEITRAAGVTGSVVNTMAAHGALIEGEAPKDQPYPRLNPGLAGKPLSEDQQAAVDALAAGGDGFGVTLLKGVTGSGKTEVYLEAVANCLRQGRQALVLLPEIGLTEGFLERVEARFGVRPGEWHSGVTMTERRRLWRMAGEGRVSMVVGARSALFLPYRDLGLIVVDEEHDTSYKQDDGVMYNARDMAVLRASLASAQVVLASATPSLESWANAEAGKYKRVDLHARFGVAELPKMRALDLRGQKMPHGRWIAPALKDAVDARLAAGEQSLLFLNRRGYAPVTTCRACGHQIACENCDSRMVEHRFLNRLMCHQCGATAPIPTACPECKTEGSMHPIGPGVERLDEETRSLWPDARVAVLSSDLFGSARALKEQIAAIAAGAADIVIGTQLVAKGHNFPLLTLVGVIDADLGLHGGDLRAAERTFQLIRQVAGRAGRHDKPGLALLQTHQPDHPVIQAILSGDDEGFWQAEANERQALAMPPYGRLAGIILSSTSLEHAFEMGNLLARNPEALHKIGAQVYGPAPAPIARVRGRHRVRLLVKAAKGAPLQQAIRAWLAPLKLPGDTRLAVDIDPQSFW